MLKRGAYFITKVCSFRGPIALVNSMATLRELCPKLSEEAGGVPVVALGIEGSANKVGVGIIRYCPETQTYITAANVRKTYITPAGQGFLPRETAWHHQKHVVALVRAVRLVDLTLNLVTNNSSLHSRHRLSIKPTCLQAISLWSVTPRVQEWAGLCGLVPSVPAHSVCSGRSHSSG